MGKKNILFITTCLQKAGAEKYLFELVSNMDKNKFNCEVLTVSNVVTESDFPHYYYDELLKQNIKVYTFLDFPYIKLKNLNFNFFSKILYKSITYLNKAYSYFFKNLHVQKIEKLINKYDWIAVIDILNYHSTIKDILDQKENFDIHLMCHKAQFSYDIYNNLDAIKAYNFAYIDKLQVTEILESNKKINSAISFPLSLDVSAADKNMILNIDPIQHLKIGIFTRINAIKPIDGCINAFKAVSEEIPNAELHLFGQVQDNDYYETLKTLISAHGLKRSVIFHGHVDDMIVSIQKNQINLIWMLSVNSFIGYASIEIGIYALPILFLNIEKENHETLENNDVIKYLSSDAELAAATIELIEDEKVANLGEQIYSKMIRDHDISKNLAAYELAVLALITTTDNNGKL